MNKIMLGSLCRSPTDVTSGGGDPSTWTKFKEVRSPSPLGRVCILIIDPRQFIRECLVEGLSGHEFDVRAFASTSEWSESADIELCRSIVVLLCGPASELRSAVHDQRSRLNVPIHLVVVSDSECCEKITDAMNDGVTAYVPTNLSLSVVLEIIRLVSVGGSFVPPSALFSPELRRSGAASLETQFQLTARQEAVLKAVQKGLANKMIAYELKMMESTVKVHLRNIMKKIGARNRTEVAILTSHPNFRVRPAPQTQLVHRAATGERFMASSGFHERK